MDLKTLQKVRKKLVKLKKQIPDSIGVPRSIEVVENMIEYIKLKTKKNIW